ncbi:hypothetical protein ACWD74_07910, partial [Streptomyces fagopyri]
MPPRPWSQSSSPKSPPKASSRKARTAWSSAPAYWWLQGPNQWPAALPELRTATLAWIDRLG